MSTRITIRSPDEVAETSRALAEANRQRLEERQRESWQWRDTLREIERRKAQVDDELARNSRTDPWRGAVPEVEPAEFVPVQLRGKRFDPAAAWWRWDKQAREIRIQTADRSVTASIEVPEFPANGISTPDPPEANVAGLAFQASGPIWYQALPAGKGRMVLLFYIQAINGQAQSTGGVQSSTTAGAPVAEALAQIYLDDFNSSQVGTSVRRRVSNAFTETVVDTRSASISSFLYSVQVKAVVVTRTAINVIQAPSALIARIREKFYYLDSASVKTINAPRDRSVLQVASIENYDMSTGQSLGGVGGVFSRFEYREVSENPGADQFADGYVIVSNVVVPFSRPSDVVSLQFANGNNYQADPATWLVLLRSYGYGKLLDRENARQDPAWGWTPAVFSFLKNYDGEFHGGAASQDLAVAYDYEYVNDVYLKGDGPRIMLEAGYNPGSLPEIKYHWFRPPAEGNYLNSVTFSSAELQPKEISGPQSLRLVPVSSAELQDYEVDQQYSGSAWPLDEYPWRNGAEVPVVTWDWGRATACIYELIDLGFTPQALLLTEQETAAWAASDPVTTRFRF